MQRLAWRLGPAIPLLVFANGSNVVMSSACCNSSSNNTTPESTTTTLPFCGSFSSSFSSLKAAVDWSLTYPSIVNAGEPILRVPARDVDLNEVKLEKEQKVIDNLIIIMRNANLISLSAPQVGIPFKIIVLEVKQEELNLKSNNRFEKAISEALLEVTDIKPFDLLVILNPKLEKKTNKTALFLENCASLPGYHALVERCLEVEVTGFNRYGEPIKINASGWKARILQHECDHLDGTLFVDKMVPDTLTTELEMNIPKTFKIKLIIKIALATSGCLMKGLIKDMNLDNFFSK